LAAREQTTVREAAMADGARSGDGGGRFVDRVVLVTGAASGIGRAASIRFAAEGARVVVSDVDAERGTEVVATIAAAGGEARFVRCDVAVAAEVEALVAATVAAYGALHVAVNNAGIPGAGHPIPDYPDADWQRGIDVMLSGVFYGMKHEIPRILEAGGGAIVNVSSGAGLIGFPGMAPYVAAKHGVIGLTKTAALEFGPQGVRVNAVCPGTARTQMVEDWMGGDPAMEQQVRDLHPIGRIAEPDEIAAAVLWLASDDASFVLGSVLAVDGAYTAQ
jgi:NAD(P)-dependent dehydrogenase (short-subunit alcohol dehydrogenase family)